MSNLSELLPAGAGAKSASFVASGTLGSGVTVALQSDGTVEAVGETAIPQAVGTPVVFAAAASRTISTVFDSSSNKVVIAYRSALDKGVVVVGTVSGTSISFGSEVIFDNGFAQYISTVFDSSNNKIVITYSDGNNSDYGTSIVGTVSGTSISFGTPVVFSSSNTAFISSTFDSNVNKALIAFRDGGALNEGRAVVATVSGTSISFGSKYYFSISTEVTSCTFDSSTNKVVIAYSDGGNNYGTAVVATISGTTISYGSLVVFRSAYTDYISLAFDSTADKIVLACRSTNGLAFVGTVSGTSISFGSAVVFDTEAQYNSTTYDPNANKTTIAYRDHTNSGYGTAIVGTVSGTSISFGSEVVFATSALRDISSAYDSSLNKIVIGYANQGNPTIPDEGTSVVFQNASTSTNSADFIGITDQAIADTATGAVIVQGGVSEKVSSLTTGSDYYVQDDGSLSTTVSSVPAGRALSSTSILLEG